MIDFFLAGTRCHEAFSVTLSRCHLSMGVEISFSFRDTAESENNPKSLRQRLALDLQFVAPCSNHNAGKSPATPHAATS